MKNIREIIGKNLTVLRKSKKLTQSELANKLNYTDKSISKWENGDSLPNIEVLVELAIFYNCKIDDLLYGNLEIDTLQLNSIPNKKSKFDIPSLISLIVIASVWVITTIIFVTLQFTIKNSIFMIFIWTITGSIALLIIFDILWGKRKNMPFLETFFLWSLLISLYLQLINLNIWPIFIIGIPLQIIIIATNSLIKQKK